MAIKVVKITTNHHNSGDQQQQQKQCQFEDISFNREEIPQLEVCILNMRSTSFKAEFQASKTKEHLFDWKHLTSDLEILRTVSGLPIDEYLLRQTISL